MHRAPEFFEQREYNFAMKLLILKNTFPEDLKKLQRVPELFEQREYNSAMKHRTLAVKKWVSLGASAALNPKRA